MGNADTFPIGNQLKDLLNLSTIKVMKKPMNDQYFRRQSIRSSIRYWVVLAGLAIQVSALKAQVPMVRLELTDVTIEEAIEALRKQTDIDFIYNHEQLRSAPRVSIIVNDKSIEQTLDEILKNSGFTYHKINGTMVIGPVKEPKPGKEIPGIKQTVRGKVIDQDSRAELPFATIEVVGMTPPRGTTSDPDGNFRLENLPVGRHTIKVSFVGYEDAYVPEVLLGSAKETVLNIMLTERLTALNEVVVTAPNGLPLNEMAMVSAKSFDAEETKRYAASFSDPARMAQVFAGVSGTDDVSNEIVIRGNSPNWLLWKLEGVEIPSPNHFAEEGYSSGAVSILSSNMLGSSDFYTGAFSAEYGNALSGVFDLKLRNGNNQQYEHTFQASFLGFDVASEGPFKKGYDGSYLFNYRYSTLSLLNDLNVEVSENALPNYQDLAFKVNLPTKKFGTFSVWGIGGLSDEAEKYLPEGTDTDEYETGYKTFFKTSMYASGIGHTFFPDDRSYIETVLSSSGSYSSEDYEQMDSLGNLHDQFFDNLQKNSIRLSSYYNRKYSSRLSMRYGFILSRLDFNYLSKEILDDTDDWSMSLDSKGHSYMSQAYVQAKYKLSDRLVGTAGAHYTFFALSKDQVIDPRLGLSMELGGDQKLTVGLGIHSRHENLPVYFVQMETGDGTQHLPNKSLQLTRSTHYVLGYQKMFGRNLQLKTELYYQHIGNLPVAANPNKYWSPIFGGFNIEDTLVNTGKGRNYGIEFTLQKFFSNQYYFLVTSSLFDSKYKPGDGQWYNTRYNINYVHNVVGGKEFKWGKNKLLGLNAKVIWSGGKRQVPIDIAASQAEGKTVYVKNSPWSFKSKDYFRVDVGARIHFFKDQKEHTLSLDIQNVGNRLNTWAHYYDFKNERIADYPMAGLIPILSYRLEF